MTRFLPIAAVVGLAACEPMPIEPGTRVLPAEVQALLLPGVPDTVAIQDGQGCYIISNEITSPSDVVTVCASRSTDMRAFSPFSASFIRMSTCSCGRAIGRMPFLKQLL